jgi:poly(3-hydroxybutyrate) depolymerase
MKWISHCSAIARAVRRLVRKPFGQSGTDGTSRPSFVANPLYAWILAGFSVALVHALHAHTPLAAAEDRGFVDRVYRDAEGEHRYAVFVPKDYSPDRTWPVILFLHGAGERGSDGRKPLDVGLGPVIKQQADSFGYLVVFPQCEDTKGRILTAWSADAPDGRRALAILKDVEKEFRVNKQRRILTGWSMGGYGAWSLAAAQPDEWAAVIPIAGGGDPETASKLTQLPIWAFHGADDTVVRSEESRQMIEAVRSAGGKPRYNELPGIGHDSWKSVYSSDSLSDWMQNPGHETEVAFSFRGKPGERTPLEADDSVPFVPAVEIPDAVSLRLGNDVLKTLAYSIPARIPRDVLTGRINDILDSTSASGITFRVRFSRIHYSGAVEHVRVAAYRKDRLNIQLGLKNVHLTIGSTYVSGSGRSAVAGPIDVVIGNRRPVWLSLALEPYVQNRRLRTRLIASRFDIPSDNWYVSQPRGVSTQGLGMTRERVTSALVSGIYGKKGRIEREAMAIVPPLLAKLEENLKLDEVASVVNAFWPLPVYRPRLRVWPSAVSTDVDGVTVRMGISAAGIDPAHSPKSPRVVNLVGRPFTSQPQGTDLRIGLAVNLLQPLTELLIDSDVARVHVLDVPEKRLASLADPAILAAAIPDLKRYGLKSELWSELVLVSPLEVRDAGPAQPSATPVDSPESIAVQADAEEPVVQGGKSADDSAVTQTEAITDADGQSQESTVPPKSVPVDPAAESPHLQFHLPRFLLSLAVHPDPASRQWLPYAQFEFSITHSVRADVVATDQRNRALRLEWEGAPEVQVSGRFAPGYQPEDATLELERIRELFVEGWQAWTGSGPISEVAVPDVALGDAKLRLAATEWDGSDLAFRFAPAGVMITNNFTEPLEYETRTPQSTWGGPYTLEPGKHHRYKVAQPLQYRRKIGNRYRAYTLPAGSNAEFRTAGENSEPGLYLIDRPQAAAQTADGTTGAE